MNPVDAHRRSLKRKAQEKKRAAKKEALSKIPLAKRDPSKLLVEIERLRDLECEDKLDGPGRMRRKHLEEQFVALKKAREKAKLPTLELLEFDPEEYLKRKKNKRSISVLDEDSSTVKSAKKYTFLDIPMPDDEELLGNGVPGLPPYLSHPLDPLFHQGPVNVVESDPIECDAPVVAAAEAQLYDEKGRLDYEVDGFLREFESS